jgi:hypothetical protein
MTRLGLHIRIRDANATGIEEQHNMMGISDSAHPTAPLPFDAIVRVD